MGALFIDVTSLFEEKEKLEKSLIFINRRIEYAQGLCKHEYVYSGNNHNDDIYECEHCKDLQYR